MVHLPNSLKCCVDGVVFRAYLVQPQMLLIIEPLDNHLAELLHFIGRGGGEYGLPVSLGKCGVIQPQSYATNNG